MSYFARTAITRNLLPKSLSESFGPHTMGNKELDRAGRCDVESLCDLGLCTSAVSITALPTEVLAHIFKFLPCRAVAKDLRLVSRLFRDVATLVLNSCFLTLGPKIERTVTTLKSRMTQVPAQTDLMEICLTLNQLEHLKLEVRRPSFLFSSHTRNDKTAPCEAVLFILITRK